MKKNKFVYMLSALAMSLIISFSGVGGSYIQAKASSGVFDVLWNTNASAWENIYKHIQLWCHTIGVYPNFGQALINAEDFAEYMITEGYSEHEVNETVHGGGGHVRDGIRVDDDGNVSYSDDVCDLFHGFILNYLETNSGYTVVETMSASEIPRSWFLDDYRWRNTIETVKNLDFCMISVSNYPQINQWDYICFYKLLTQDFCLSPGDTVFNPSVSVSGIRNSIYTQGTYDYLSGYGCYLSEYVKNAVNELATHPLTWDSFFKINTSSGNGIYFLKENISKYNESTNIATYTAVCSSDGRLVKVFNSALDFLNYNLNKQPYYYTQNWVNYDASVDNSITMTNDQYNYNLNNGTAYYQTIQNNITNYGGELTESDIQKIVDDAVKEILSNMENSGSGDSNNGGSDNNDSNESGNGVGSMINGISKLFDTILTLAGNLMGIVADFTQSILDLFSGFTNFTDGFSSFLSGAFGFIPKEIWDVIQVGLSLMILLAVIKFLRK